MVTCLPDSQVYAKQLLLKRHGYPLWVPEPYGNSVAYRTKGVRIGDVGYVTPDGAFETLFNLRAARTDPINSRGVPEGFEQFMVPEDDIVHIPNYHQSNSSITSASAKKRTISCEGTTPGISTGGVGVGAGAQFTWDSSEGAILHLPDGASRIISPAELFRDTALHSAKNWYKFANVTLRRGVHNGALYLVTGFDKSRSWMVGSFSDASSDSRASLTLDVACFGGARVSYSYAWETSSPAVFRTGPTQSVVDSCDALSPHRTAILRDDEIFHADAPGGQNQCVFLRGYRIMLRTNPVSSMLGISTKVSVDSILNTSPKNIFQPTAKSPFTLSGSMPSAYNDNVSSGGSKTIDSPEPRDEVILEQYPDISVPYHPSNAINAYLLNTVSDKPEGISWSMY
ncbi:hypothetical protein BDZ94DRAFT_593306 [Collybia nuda]|uniref:Uncharacterized protein n=1 Tax=Collybia nuda TaxID=64659 RepID=A0A9P5Y8E7_9AGAR|nr:hypothetical protein BDZ94DRAFT_593306 [Collybia nuda]